MLDRRRKGEEKQTARMEIRLGASLRTRFLETCQRAGDTPSDVLREAMADYVLRIEAAERKTLKQELFMKLIRNPLKAAAMTLATATAAFTLAVPAVTAETDPFKLFDTNNDGVLTSADTFVQKTQSVLNKAADANEDGVITREEFDALEVTTTEYEGDLSALGIADEEGVATRKVVFLRSPGSDKVELTEAQLKELISGDGDIEWTETGGKKVTFKKRIVLKEDETSAD